MRELLAALPVALPLAAAAASFAAWRSLRAQRALALVGLGALLAVTVVILVDVAARGPLVLAIGGWRAPVGVAFRVDLAAALMATTASAIGLMVAIYALADVPQDVQGRGFWPLLVLLVAGVSGAFVTADLFNMFVWFEVMLISSFVLLALGGSRAQLAGGHVYVVLTMIGSALFLIGVGLLYASVRTLDLAQLAERTAELARTRPGLALAIEAVLLVAFGIKAAVFPLMFWLPASYHTPIPACSALFAGLLTKVGVYAMIRIGAGVFPDSEVAGTAIAAVAIVTMVIGVLGALAQRELRRLLSFHVVSQIGYMVAGLALVQGPPPVRRFALAATFVFVVHNILAKTCLFLIAGIVRRVRGTETLDRLGGLARTHPALAVMFAIAALALAGVPPLLGFWAKLGIFAAGLAADQIAIVVTAAAVSLLTLTSMVKIWLAAFAGKPVGGAPGPRAMYVGAGGLAAIILALSLAPDPLYRIALAAADQFGGSAGTFTSSGGAP